MTLPTSGFYTTVMQSYLGYLSADQQQSIWSNFLQTNGLTANPSPIDPTEQAAFVSFIEKYYTDNQSALLSPEEIQKRRIMFETFTTVLHMLSILQNTIAAQTNNVAFYANYQDEYTKMLAKIPILVANPNNFAVPSTDPTKFTFGYNNISLSDIAEYVASNTPTHFTLFAALGLGSGIEIDTAAHPPTVGIKVDADLGSQGFVQTAYSVNISAITDPPANGDPTVYATVIEDALIQLYYGTRTITNTLNAPVSYTSLADLFNAVNGSLTGPLGTIPWQYTQPYPVTTTDSTQQDINSNVAKLRAEVNQENQSYISTITAFRTTIRDLSQVVQDNLSQTREAYSQQADLIRSITESLRGLISAIYK